DERLPGEELWREQHQPCGGEDEQGGAERSRAGGPLLRHVRQDSCGRRWQFSLALLHICAVWSAGAWIAAGTGHGHARASPAARMADSNMRSEALDEAVSVRADFHGGAVTPVAFSRRGREHRVARVNARWVDRAGRHPRFYFSVTDESGDVYQLQLQG